jgi:ATP-dependent exoDNAse (exonuclease V) beta subunit
MPFKIYRSSAGSGKTFTLVKEYLRIALGSHGDTAYRGILAITFTNKAAEEMKGRVISTLKELSDQSLEVGHMGKMLQQELNLDATTLSQRADRVLRSMLHNYADLSISTIDSFTHRVIRTFAQDFGLPVNFEVEMDTDRLILSLTDRLLAEVGIEKGITDALIDLSLAQAEDEKSWSIDDALKDMAKTIFNEEGRFHLEGMKGIAMADFIALRKRLHAALHNDKAILLATANAAVALIKTNNLEIGHIAGGANGVAGYLDKICKGKFDAAHTKADEYVEQGTWHGSKAKGIEKAAIDGIAAQLQQAYETVLALLARRKRLSFILKNVYGIALLERMSEIVHTLQEEQEVLHIGEFNHLVGEVVMREQAPFIYERLGYRYHHFLVDEFQDTNVLQWFNLLPLIDESLATDGLCLVVGDAKQSIYRWRGGEVQQFVSLPAVHRADYLNDQLANDTVLAEMLDQREQSLQTHVEEHSLQSNFRTLPEVVHFNNALFTDLQQHMPEALQSMYDGVAQATPKGKEGGLVCIRYIPRPEKESSFGDYRPITLDQIKVWVDECLADGYEPGDIAIISRVNDRGVEVAQFLIEEGYNVVSSESLLINSSPYVRLLVNVAVFLVNKHDTTNMAELVQHLCMTRKEENLVSERLALVGKEKSSGVYQLLKSLYPDVLWNRMRQLPIYGLFEQLRFHLLDGVKQPHLIYFMDEVLEYSRKEGNDINGFMRYWIEHRGKRSIALTENRDAIRIHQCIKARDWNFQW